MSDLTGPAGGNRPGDDDLARMLADMLGDPSLADNPQLRDALKNLGVDNLPPGQQAMLAQQFSAMFSGPVPEQGVDGSTALDMARRVAAADGGDPSVGDADRRAAAEAGQIAGMWLAEVTDLARGASTATAWSRAEWIEATMPAWLDAVQPVAQAVTAAMVSATRGQLDELIAGGLPEGMAIPGLPPGADPAAMLGQVEPMMRRLGSAMFSAQTGQAVAQLSGAVVSGTEVGLPLVPGNTVALLPHAIAELADGLDVDAPQVRLYLAVRESARCALFTSAPWLASALTSAVRAYAGDITIDVEGLQRRMEGIDVSNPQAVQEAMGSDLFAIEPSAAQQRALANLETLLALVEGWVDVVSAQATVRTLPASAALGEAIRRRRATGGPAEVTFAQLVGLELRPRRLRDAANLFAALEDSGGAALRDGVWAHPDLLPTAGDLDDPLGYVERAREPVVDELDAELSKLLDDEGRQG